MLTSDTSRGSIPLFGWLGEVGRGFFLILVFWSGRFHFSWCDSDTIRIPDPGKDSTPLAGKTLHHQSTRHAELQLGIRQKHGKSRKIFLICCDPILELRLCSHGGQILVCGSGEDGGDAPTFLVDEVDEARSGN